MTDGQSSYGVACFYLCCLGNSNKGWHKHSMSLPIEPVLGCKSFYIIVLGISYISLNGEQLKIRYYRSTLWNYPNNSLTARQGFMSSFNFFLSLTFCLYDSVLSLFIFLISSKKLFVDIFILIFWLFNKCTRLVPESRIKS